MDVAKAFTYVTEDERWVGKIGVGVLVSLLGILIVPALLLPGYMVGIVRNVVDGAERPLPEWEDLGQLFKDGLAVVLAQLVYTLPFWLVTCIATVATIGFGALAETNEEVAAVGITGTALLIVCLSLIFAIALLFISPAIVIQYAREDNLSACFRFGEVIAIARNNIADILITALASLAASFLLSMVIGVVNIVPCLGQIAAVILGMVASPYLIMLSGHLYGQIAAKDGKATHFA